MKTRIEIITKNDGTVKYYPQKSIRDKHELIWFILIPLLGWSCIRDWFGYEYFYVRLFDLEVIKFDNIHEAEKFIDDELERVRTEKEKEHLAKIKSTTYLKYP